MRYCSLSGYAFASTQNGRQCACGNSFGHYGIASNLDCNTTCNGKLQHKHDKYCLGNESEYCGGNWKSYVWYTNATSCCPTTPSSIICSLSCASVFDGDNPQVNYSQITMEIVSTTIIYPSVSLFNSSVSLYSTLTTAANFTSITSSFYFKFNGSLPTIIADGCISIVNSIVNIDVRSQNMFSQLFIPFMSHTNCTSFINSTVEVTTLCGDYSEPLESVVYFSLSPCDNKSKSALTLGQLSVTIIVPSLFVIGGCVVIGVLIKRRQAELQQLKVP